MPSGSITNLAPRNPWGTPNQSSSTSNPIRPRKREWCAPTVSQLDLSKHQENAEVKNLSVVVSYWVFSSQFVNGDRIIDNDCEGNRAMPFRILQFGLGLGQAQSTAAENLEAALSPQPAINLRGYKAEAEADRRAGG
jgi:hypothetical protein